MAKTALCQSKLPFEAKPLSRIIVRNKDELISKLAEAEADVREGRVYPAEEVFYRLREKYGAYSC